MWLWLLAFVTSTSKQKSCMFRVQLCWLWISGYRPSENWLVSMAASLVQCLWEEGKSRAPVQKAEQIQVNHLPPRRCRLCSGVSTEPAQPTDLLTPTPGWWGFNAITQMCRRQILNSRRQRNQTVWPGSCTHPQRASVRGKPLHSIQHGMGWEPEYSWVSGTTWHPSTAKKLC